MSEKVFKNPFAVIGIFYVALYFLTGSDFVMGCRGLRDFDLGVWVAVA
ncbi:MAG: hypothetical protein AAB787_01335 [Patescibacteria group bacterium]